MALACVRDASAAVRLTLGDAAASGLAEPIRSAAPNTLWKRQRADQLAGLNPQQLLLDARELVDRVEPDRTCRPRPWPGARRPPWSAPIAACSASTPLAAEQP